MDNTSKTKIATDVIKGLAPIIGASVSTPILKNMQKTIDGVYGVNNGVINGEKARRTIRSADSMRMLAEAGKLDKENRKRSERLIASGVSPFSQNQESPYVEAIRKIASKAMARRSYLDDLSFSNKEFADRQKNNIDSRVASQLAQATDDSLKYAQEALKPAGDVASKELSSTKNPEQQKDELKIQDDTKKVIENLFKPKSLDEHLKEKSPIELTKPKLEWNMKYPKY